jgi:DNA-binding LacI/PurR family transcriptional regulator
MVTRKIRPTRATIEDVAAAAGVSRGTVSRVLNQQGYASEAAVNAVHAAVDKVGYVRNTAARNLVTNKSHAVGLIVREPLTLFTEDPNIGSILKGTNSVLSEANYQLISLIIDSERDSRRVGEYLSGGFVDGVIIVSARADDPIVRTISDIELPAAFVGHPQAESSIPFVGIDNCTAATAITTRLRDTGRTVIGMLAAGLDRDSGQDRLIGFREALGAQFDENLVVDCQLYSYMAGVEGMTELLRRRPDVDGVFAASDAVAAGAMSALHAYGRRVPEDVGIVGFDDSAWALRCQPLLSTVHQPADLLGSKAAESVLAQINGESASGQGIFLPTSIAWRDSA